MIYKHEKVNEVIISVYLKNNDNKNKITNIIEEKIELEDFKVEYYNDYVDIIFYNFYQKNVFDMILKFYESLIKDFKALNITVFLILCNEEHIEIDDKTFRELIEKGNPNFELECDRCGRYFTEMELHYLDYYVNVSEYELYKRYDDEWCEENESNHEIEYLCDDCYLEEFIF